MADFRNAREMLLISHDMGFIDDLEFSILYDLNKSSNPDFPYWDYEPFDLEKVSEADCWADFRLYEHDIYRLAELLNLTDRIECYNRSTVDKIEGLCILRKGLHIHADMET